MSDASPEEVIDWIQKCVANPEVALTTVQRMVEEDPAAENEYMVHASRFLAFGQQVLDRVEENNGDVTEETLALCQKSIVEYSLARNAEDSTYVEEEIRKETVVVKPGGLFSKAKTEVRETKLSKTRNIMDWAPLETHLDSVALILEKGRPKGVQQLLGKTKLLYLLAADRISNSSAVERELSENESFKAAVRSLCEVFIEAPFKIGSALFASYTGTETIVCKLYEELEPFGPGGRQNPGSLLMARRSSDDTSWRIHPVKPISDATG